MSVRTSPRPSARTGTAGTRRGYRRNRDEQSRFDLYQAVTDEILDLLHCGVAPWKSCVLGEPIGRPMSLTTGRPYRGINVFLLAVAAANAGHTSAYWATYRQAQALGGQVRRGERGTLVVFWKTSDGEIDPETGKADKRFVLRYYRSGADSRANGADCDARGAGDHERGADRDARGAPRDTSGSNGDARGANRGRRAAIPHRSLSRVAAGSIPPLPHRPGCGCRRRERCPAAPADVKADRGEAAHTPSRSVLSAEAGCDTARASARLTAWEPSRRTYKGSFKSGAPISGRAGTRFRSSVPTGARCLATSRTSMWFSPGRTVLNGSGSSLRSAVPIPWRTTQSSQPHICSSPFQQERRSCQ